MSTTYDRPAAQVRAASGLNILAGFWLILSPWALAFSTIEAATWNSVLVGLGIAILAMLRIATPLRYEGLSWLNFFLGLWLVLSPFLLNFGDVTGAMWNCVIVGLIVLVLAAWSAVGKRTTPESPPRGSL